MKGKPTSLLLKPTLLKKIKVFAASHDKSMTEIFNEAVELYLSKYPEISLPSDTKKSRFTDVVLNELEKCLSPMAARAVRGQESQQCAAERSVLELFS